ncbi:hypothetical protein ACFWTC_34310, partial [Streptomyces sp. NPDC058619]|uniref:hypothetical protein n=1 Tax=Streptomyces sp. NPDC058619 TaxID=3346559 RepID=UPI003662A655
TQSRPESRPLNATPGQKDTLNHNRPDQALLASQQLDSTGPIATLLALAAASAARDNDTNRHGPGTRRPMPGTH